MKIEVHFYNKRRVAVTIAAEEIYGEHDHELLMYAWFTLRQLHNQGHHLAADAFAGLVTPEKYDMITTLLENNPKMPNAVDLLAQAQRAKFPRDNASAESDITGSQEVAQYAAPLPPGYEYADLIDKQLLAMIPELIQYPRFQGDKRFVGTIPPPNFQFKGFGILGNLVGKEIPYYAFQSLLASLKYFAKRYSRDQLRLKRLAFVADACGRAHMMNIIRAGQHLDLAADLVDKSEEIT
jgi:hypothetical protein